MRHSGLFAPLIGSIICLLLLLSMSNGGMASQAPSLLGSECRDVPPYTKIGDLVFCELTFYNLDPGWDHVAIYVGEGLIIEATPGGEGVVRLNSVEHLVSYTKAICYGRVKAASEEQRFAAVAFAYCQLGKPYQYLDLSLPFLNRLKDPSAQAAAWYCTELVWAAYYHQGINLDRRGPLRGPVMPSEICWDSDMEMYTEHRLNSWHLGMYTEWVMYQLLHLPILLAWLSLPSR